MYFNSGQKFKTLLLDKGKLEDKTTVEYIQKNKNISHLVEILLLAEDNILLQKRDNVLKYQNTLKDNYTGILKDFLIDISKSVELLKKTILKLYADPTLKNSFIDNPILAGHFIAIDDKDIRSLSIEDKYKEYALVKKKRYKEIIVFLEAIKTSKKNSLPENRIKEIIEYLSRVIEDEYLRHPLMLRYGLRGIFDSIDIDSYKKNFPLAVEELNIILSSNSDVYHYIYHATNLIDEKIIKKGEVVYPFVCDGVEFDIVSLNAGKLLKRRTQVAMKVEGVNFSIDYYVKKVIFEQTTQRTMTYGMSMLKDYLARDKFIQESLQGEGYSSDHPFIVQSEAKKEFIISMDKLQEAYHNSKQIVLKVSSLKGLDAEYNYKEWKRVLNDTKILFKYQAKDDDKLSSKSMLMIISRQAQSMASIIFDRSEEKHSDLFRITINEEYQAYLMIMSILDTAYSDIEYGENKDIQSSLGFHDRATFHTTLKDSFVVDFRREENEVSSFAQKIIDEFPEAKHFIDILRDHPYHNYYEFDKDIFKNGVAEVIGSLTNYFSAATSISPSIDYRCSFKIRKLGNYKASGIYFSHTKTMGIDFRHGMGSYAHELAHHIDLSGYKKERKKMVYLLWEYFNPRVVERREYFMREEEMIARAGEVALLLKLSKYRDLQGKLPYEELILKMKYYFESSPESSFMKTWDEYFSNSYYLDALQMIKRGELFLLDGVIEYFTSYWSSEVSTTNVLKDVNVIFDKNISKKYPESHHSYDYWLCDIYEGVHPSVNKNKYLKELFILS